MSNYKINIYGCINLSDYSTIHDYMGIVGPQDNFTIEMSYTEEEDAKVICNILESDGFDIIVRGGIDDEKCYIRACRRK